MILFPAIDLKDGKAVRLRQGRAEDSTVFSPDPITVARHWQRMRAPWLHLVDLDGAFQGVPKNTELIHEICEAVTIPVQLGGGIRTRETAKAYLKAGVKRIIVGTIALEDPDLFADLCRSFPNKVGVSLDAVCGILKTHGWVENSGQSVFDVLPRLIQAGAAFIVYTDIERDGMQTGPNFIALQELAQKSPIPIIASGGISNLDDVKKLYTLSKLTNIEGAITGRAIYEGSLDLSEAVHWLDAQDKKKPS